MEITLEKKDLNGVIKVTVSPDDYKETVMEKLKDYAKKANLKGFRPGKVPISLVKKMVGQSILLEELNKVLIENLNSYISDEDLDLIGNPLPRTALNLDLEVDNEKDIVFDYDVAFAPQIDINFEVEETPSKYIVVMDDVQLEKEVASLRERYGKMENPDESVNGDTLFGKVYVQAGQEASIPEDFRFGSTPSVMIPWKPETMPEDSPFKDTLGGKKAEDIIEGVQLGEMFAKDEDIKTYWQWARKEGEAKTEGKPEPVTDEELAALKALTFDFKVKKVNRIVAVEMNEEFYEKVFPNAEVKTEEAFRAKLSEEMEKFFTEDADRLVKNKSAQAIMDITTVELPAEFLKRWLIQTEEKIDESNIDEEWERFEKGLIWTLITKQMRVDNPDLEVKDEELMEKVGEVVDKQFGQMGDLDEERKKNIIEYYLKDENMKEQVFRDVADQKIFDYVLGKLGMAEQEINASEYVKLEK